MGMKLDAKPKIGQDKVCVSIKDRELNRVDILNLQIKRIRENCEHDFRLVRKPELQTVLSGVVVGKLEGPANVRGSELAMTLVCLHCSQEEETTIMETCPRCLGKVDKRSYSLGAGSRELYFGCKHLYFAVRLSCCQDCGLTIASDEWNQ